MGNSMLEDLYLTLLTSLESLKMASQRRKNYMINHT